MYDSLLDYATKGTLSAAMAGLRGARDDHQKLAAGNSTSMLGPTINSIEMRDREVDDRWVATPGI